MPKKQSLKDKVEDNELDLSMCELTTIPVDEMMKLTKVTTLDMSCNLLTSLPDNFCGLRHILKLDLSKNYLAELPANFGHLVNLQHLDLLNNRLHILPLSFQDLHSLKWLDLKDNPLDETLQLAAGDCLDESQCRKCAQNVLKFMKFANLEVEKKKERELKQEIVKERQRKLEEEQRRVQKKADKEKKRAAYLRKQERLRQEKETLFIAPEPDVSPEPDETGDTEIYPEEPDSLPSGTSWTAIFLTTIVGLLSLLVGLYLYCDRHKSTPACLQILHATSDIRTCLENIAHRAGRRLHELLSSFVTKDPTL